MTLFGVRFGVWLAAAGLAAGALALWLGVGDAGVGGRERPDTRPSKGLPERAAAHAAGRGTRIRVGARELGGAATSARAAFEAPVANGLAAPVGPSAVGTGSVSAAVAEPGTTLAELAAAPPAPLRPPEVVSLERGVVRSLAGLPREDADALGAAVEAELAALEPAPGESPGDFEARREDTRARSYSDELLLRARLKALYAQQVYPHDFLPDQLVVPMERQLIQALPPVDRAAALRQLVDAGLPGPPRPRFEVPGSGLSYRGGPGL